MKRNNLPLETILEHFYIEDDVLKWSHDISHGSWKKKGDNAGSISNQGYLRVGVKTDKKRMYMVHRLMYQIYNNIEVLEDSLDIDHVDLNPLNNSKENLRIATKSENNCNNPIRKDNTSGYSNIYVEHGITTTTYIVSLQKDKKQTTVRFKSLEDAILFRDAKRKEMHGDFAKNT